MSKLKDLLDNKSNSACYFIADIAANHDRSLSKAKDLIHAAASGAHAAKFQNFNKDNCIRLWSKKLKKFITSKQME